MRKGGHRRVLGWTRHGGQPLLGRCWAVMYHGARCRDIGICWFFATLGVCVREGAVSTRSTRRLVLLGAWPEGTRMMRESVRCGPEHWAPTPV